VGGCLCHGGGAEEAGELAGGGDDSDVSRLAAFAQSPVQSVEAVLGTPGDLEHVVGLAFVTAAQGDADARLARVVPGGLDQQSACVAGAGFGDRSACLAFAGLVRRGNQTESGGELAGSLEAAEVADLEAEDERGQCLDPAEAAQPRDRRPQLVLLRDP
jgi:hypothetical protein